MRKEVNLYDKEVQCNSSCKPKDGTGKTTTTKNVGIGLANQGKKVLMVDFDPQGDLSACLGL